MPVDPLAQVKQGFASLDVEASYKKTALTHMQHWLTDPLFAGYRQQIIWLIAEQQWELLLDSFYQVIPFGTGGRRGTVGIGTNRMNPWSVKASAQGHANYLLNQFSDVKKRGMVIAYDVRKYPETGIYNSKLPNPVRGITSKQFAEQAASVYAANGIPVFLFEGIRTTPELSFAIRFLKTRAGVNISASHNPKEDNGKKIYGDDGGQLIPPEDEVLCNAVDAVKEIKEAATKKLISLIGKEVDAAYLAATKQHSLFPKERNVVIIYTPLHGVGSTSVLATLQALGFSVIPEPKTSVPDGAFPDVTFNIPNPEVPESFETAYTFAKQHTADLIIASDPDADRSGFAVFHLGKWHYLNGNQIATLVLAFVLETMHARKQLNSKKVVATTLVTTIMLTKLCEHYGVSMTNDLLVGCKYIAHIMRELEEKNRGDDFICGFEESHGALIGMSCRDKDATGPAVLLAELASIQKKKGKTLIDYLESIYQQFGYVENVGTSLVMKGAAGVEKIKQIQETLRKQPPKKIGIYPVLQCVDRWKGSKILSETDRSARNVLVFHLQPPQGVESMKVTIRPSGTEPKTKVYIEVLGKRGTAPDVLAKIRQSLRTAFLQHVYGILKIDMEERGLLLSDLLPVELKVQYFAIEKELIAAKALFEKQKLSKKVYEQKINELLLPFGKDPTEKVDACFRQKYKTGMKAWLRKGV
ncbi:phospho-sugar mutase [Candidatus Woesearchaeota archaeon]|nr:phospho-sugar mutase [Candidatus Woesearchaeota archaeon]